MELLRTVRSAPILTVADIMIPQPQFIRAQDSHDAADAFRDHPDVDLLPLPLHGAPTHVIYRRDMSKHRIAVSMLLSESTGILDLPRLFNERHEAFFVLGEREISGLVHFSDLNNPLCKIPFFGLTQLVERKYIGMVREHFSERRAVDALGTRKSKSLFGLISDLTKQDVLPFPAAAMTFKELLTYCMYHELCYLADDEVEVLNDFRNRVSHAGRVLIMKFDDCAMIANVHQICLRLLGLA